MKRFSTLVIGLVVFPLLLAAQQRYQQVRVELSALRDLTSIARIGIAVDHGGGKPGAWVDLFVSEAEAQRLRDAGFALTVLIKDWSQEYARRLERDRATPLPTGPGGVPDHFHLGSMGGFLTLEELRAEIDLMRATFPFLVEGPDSIGSTVEGRPIWSVKLSARAAFDEGEPRALFTALTHAREGGGLMVLLYVMWHLLEQYGVDPEITTLLDSRELFFVPVVNPDGYAHNAFLEPTGGGMWRKNRRVNADGSIGVDLNRNFGYFWGYDDIGSSPQGSFNTFRGSSAFSEPETRAIRDLCIEKAFAIGLNYHTYGNLLIYPWGYLDTDTADSLLYRSLARHLTRVTGYTYGTGGETVGYTTNGDADDWMYGEATAKPSLISFTPEVGTDEDGFWPVPSRILPQAQENLDANIIVASAAGPYVRIGDPVRIGGGIDTVTYLLPLADAGMVPVQGPITITLESDQLEFQQSQIQIAQVSDPVLVDATARNGSVPGRRARVVVRLSYPGGATRDTVTLRAGEPHVVFEETAEQDLTRWKVSSNTPESSWGVTDELAAAGTYSVTDSPLRFYSNNTVATLTLAQPVALSGSGAELRFLARWDIETNYDIFRVEISTDGSTWTPLAGRHTATGSGSGRQSISQPGYDGIQHEWVEEVMDLDAYVGRDVLLRCILETDASMTREGVFLDNIRILTYDAPLTDVPETALPMAFILQQNYPNPFNPTTTLGFSLPRVSPVRLVLYDMLGRELVTLAEGIRHAGSYEVVVNASGLASGVYFCRMTADGFSAVRRLVVLR
jgi:carboxypeptidase T